MIDGKPLAAGFIRVIDAGPRATIGRMGVLLGCFTKDDGCLIGTHKVEIPGFRPVGDEVGSGSRKYASTGSSG
jgi:hypothetical protein